MNTAKSLTDSQPKSVFLRALECTSPEELAAYLDRTCAGDEELRKRVDELLQAHKQAGRFLGGASLGDAGLDSKSDQPIAERPGSVIGPYKLLEQIGEGGFGVVFMAEQTQPIQRKVALKIIKPGMDTRQVIARFEAERQALALMDHPNIAYVLDAGATGPASGHPGRPYFVMELARGVPITHYCDENRVSIRERLELFVTVCHAVQHAHQKGIIHRDIKPTNVLVTLHDGRPVVKVIDFGVAKATGQKLTDKTLFTGFAQLLGTPLYMSPEQAELSGLDVDTRSDIYSLGVLLYELISGTTPFEKERLRATPYDELRRIIREEEPLRPSMRISTLRADLAVTLAEQRRTDARSLEHETHGDLDWIVMKCLEKDRNRRYESAASLADDVRRHLNFEPVSAVAPSRIYRASKFIRRNKWPVIAAAAVLLGLIAGIIGTTIGLVSQSRQRAIAERERAEAQLNFAVALHAQRDYAMAEDVYRQQLASSSPNTPADRQRIALARLRLAEIVGDTRGAAASEPLFREALAAYRDAFSGDDANVALALTSLALILRTQQKFAEAEPLFREAYDFHRHSARANHRAIGESGANLANVLTTLGRYGEAEQLAREAIAHHLLAVPQDIWALAFARIELGRDLIVMGRFADAERELLEAQQLAATTSRFQFGPLSLAALYTKWDQAEPGKGYDAKAQQHIRALIRTFVSLDEPTEANMK